LARGAVLAVPTESSYGLAVDPRNPEGVAAVYRVKGRGAEKALPVAVAGRHQLEALGVVAPAEVVAQLEARWPAALTAVLPLRAPLPAAPETATLAVRVPAHEGLRALLEELGPLTVTSANRSGEPPILDPARVAELLGTSGGMVVDGGILAGGPPSTLVVWEDGGWQVLRRGRYPVADLIGPRET
ncbi:MAG: L-threonylcarbamoyladenylate synthase, partial [Acidobacteria bacterium]|nr:L-threonylcarbamoyladenylate synthase [Acidobacteriota bacterium]